VSGGRGEGSWGQRASGQRLFWKRGAGAFGEQCFRGPGARVSGEYRAGRLRPADGPLRDSASPVRPPRGRHAGARATGGPQPSSRSRVPSPTGVGRLACPLPPSPTLLTPQDAP